MDNAEKLRELAAWYRELAEQAEIPRIWAGRIRMAELLELEADGAAPATVETVLGHVDES